MGNIPHAVFLSQLTKYNIIYDIDIVIISFVIFEKYSIKKYSKPRLAK